MKTFHRVLCGLVILVGGAGSTFAAGTPDYSLALNYASVPDETTIGSVDVPVTQAIRDWFTSVTGASKSWKNAKGSQITAGKVDGSKIDAPLATLSESYKDSIDAVLNDSDLRASLESLIQPALQASLVRGSVEKATMRIGRHIWTLTIDGPEDN